MDGDAPGMDGNREQLRQAAVALRRAGRTRREMREALGVSDPTLTALLGGEPPAPSVLRPRAKDDLRDRARALRDEGLSLSQVARELGVPRSSVVRWTRRAREVEPPSHPGAEPEHGPQHPRQPTGDPLGDRAVELRLAGMSRAQICRELGVGRRRLDKWLAGVPVPPWTRRPRAKDEMRGKATELRRQGWSYGKIAAELGVSKSSVAQWVGHQPTRISEETRLERLRTAAVRRSSTRRRRTSARRQNEKLAASRDIGPLTDRELFLLGVGLYWAEGHKDKSRLGGHLCERANFVNSDPDMVRVFLAWLRLLGYSNQDLILRLMIHESADVPTAMTFWAEVVGISPEEFSRTALKRHNPKTRRVNTGDQYRGCLSVTVRRSAALYRAIEGWWKGVAGAGEGRVWSDEPRWGPKASPQPRPGLVLTHVPVTSEHCDSEVCVPSA